ncbi:MAG TPA: hypothetical protein VGC39_08970 [Candidatus Methylacidiphilales bacterium]
MRDGGIVAESLDDGGIGGEKQAGDALNAKAGGGERKEREHFLVMPMGLGQPVEEGTVNGVAAQFVA